MKGLLIKDIRLLGQQKKLLFLYAVMAIVLGYSMDSTFLVSYFPMIGVFLVLSTISLDNFDNGMAFLMTLPISGKLYAVEKYVISLLVTAGTWIIAVALQFVMLMIKKEEFVAAEMLGQDLLFLPVLVFIIVLMIPMDLKFGTEKGRMVLFAVFGIAMILLLGGKAIVEFLSKNA
ncbi:MAG: ABC-2 transporter permease, partial [Lachnospiraceae bacterium]|nr:ABC-2 transporter permease [Lachnospiraceae bacterium]